MTITRIATRKAAAMAAGTLLSLMALVGCGSDDDAGTAGDAPTTEASATTSVSPSDSATDAATGGATEAAQLVDVNTASLEELTAAFEAAGVEDAERWATEVEGYRPYTDDKWARLKTELAKYQIDPATFAKIISVLEV